MQAARSAQVWQTAERSARGATGRTAAFSGSVAAAAAASADMLAASMSSSAGPNSSASSRRLVLPTGESAGGRAAVRGLVCAHRSLRSAGSQEMRRRLHVLVWRAGWREGLTRDGRLLPRDGHGRRRDLLRHRQGRGHAHGSRLRPRRPRGVRGRGGGGHGNPLHGRPLGDSHLRRAPPARVRKTRGEAGAAKAEQHPQVDTAQVKETG